MPTLYNPQAFLKHFNFSLSPSVSYLTYKTRQEKLLVLVIAWRQYRFRFLFIFIYIFLSF